MARDVTKPRLSQGDGVFFKLFLTNKKRGHKKKGTDLFIACHNTL